MSVDRSALLLSIPTLSQLNAPSFLTPAIIDAVSNTRKSLLIIVFSPLFSTSTSATTSLAREPVRSWKVVQSLLTFIYVEAARRAAQLDNILLNVDVVLHDSDPAALSSETFKLWRIDEWEAIVALDGGLDETIPFDDLPISHLPTTIIPIPSSAVPSLPPSIPPSPSIDEPTNDELLIPNDATPSSSTSSLPPVFPVAALGGTFDHLHSGHKILLSIGAWVSRDKLIVGVTDEPLLRKKTLAHLIEPLPTRISRIHAFCSLFKPGIIYDIVPIQDIYGPTGWDADIQALVLSGETREGAGAVAKLRHEKSLPPLEPLVIDVISSSTDSSTSSILNYEDEKADAAVLRDAKMSSTAIRRWIAEHGGAEAQR